MQKSVVRHGSKRRRFAAAGVVAVALAAAPAAAQAEGWVPGPRFTVGYPSVGAAVAAAPSGAAYATWSVPGSRGIDAVFQTAAPDGTVGPLYTLPDAGMDVMQEIAASDGGAAVAWTREGAGSTTKMVLTQLAPDGTPRATTALETVTDGGYRETKVAIAPDGSALVIWVGYGDDDVNHVKAARVSPSGTVTPVLTVDPGDGAIAAALAPDGTGWITWADDSDVQWLARVTAAGALAARPAALGSASAVSAVTLTASAAGAVFNGLADRRIGGVRLPLSGPLVGRTFAAATEAADGSAGAALLADDGTATIAWSTAAGVAVPSYTTSYSRFAPGAETAPAQAIAPSTGGLGQVLPRLAQMADGSLLTGWVDVGSMLSGPLVTARIGADGSRGPARATGLDASLLLMAGGMAERTLPFTATRDGGAFAATVSPGVMGFAAITTAVLDVHPPQVTATLPTAGQTAQRLDFAATASDRSGVSHWWDFGDGSGARTASAAHAYASPGSYAASLTVTDGAGNQTVVARTVEIAAPPAPQSRRAAAALKLTGAVRNGATVTVTGTIARGATGRVTLLYTQKDGRRALTAKASAKVAKGRFRAVVRLARGLTRRFRLKPTVTAAYAGDASTAAARTVRTVTVRTARRAGKKKR